MREFYNSEFKDICNNIAKGHNLADDLHSETVIWIFEKSTNNNLDIQSIKNKVYFFTAVALKIYNSDKFKKAYDHNYRKWGKVANVELSGIEKETEVYNFEKESLLQWIEAETYEYKTDSEDEWYRKRLLSLYIEEGSERALSKKLNIPRPTISKDIRDYIKYLKEKYDTTYSQP